MAEEIALLEVQDILAEEGAGIDVDNAEDVVIDVSLLSSMQKQLASTAGSYYSPFTICRVPENIRECDRAAYSPRIVSIGPFHRGRENLRAMEEHKWRYLQKALAWSGQRNNLEKFLKEMKAIERKARNCYSGNIQMSSNEFVKMMLLDGTFIIFLIVGFVTIDASLPDYEIRSGLIRRDMLLLENQLPFFVLECLWELINDLPRATLPMAVLESFSLFSYKLGLKSPEEDPKEDVIHHLLHLLHLSIKPDSPTRKAQTTSASGRLSSLRLCRHIGKTLRFLCPTYFINTYDRFRTPIQQSLLESPKPLDGIPSATELQEAGVTFHKLKQARSFFEVRFEHGSMKMPRLCIYDSTGILFRNFIAFEQCFPEWGNDFTSYCLFIDFLVNTPRDVSILMEANIIKNGLGSNEEVALLFNKLGKGIFWSINDTYLTDLFERVNEHTQKRWPKWRAKLARDYFGSP